MYTKWHYSKTQSMQQQERPGHLDWQIQDFYSVWTIYRKYLQSLMGTICNNLYPSDDARFESTPECKTPLKMVQHYYHGKFNMQSLFSPFNTVVAIQMFPLRNSKHWLRIHILLCPSRIRYPLGTAKEKRWGESGREFDNKRMLKRLVTTILNLVMVMK